MTSLSPLVPNILGIYSNNKKNDNIFKSKKIIENEDDKHCESLNKHNSFPSNYYFVKGIDGSLIKYFENKILLRWEIKIYLEFVHNEFFPLMDASSQYIKYHTTNMISLEEYLLLDTIPINYLTIFEKLFSFIKLLSKKRFVHGNIHLGLIYLYPKQIKPKFYLIDFSNSYILDKSLNHEKETNIRDTLIMFNKLDRISYINEFSVNNFMEYKEQNLKYWDLFCLFISLKTFILKHKKLNQNKKDGYINYLTKLIQLNIPISIYNRFKELYNMKMISTTKN